MIQSERWATKYAEVSFNVKAIRKEERGRTAKERRLYLDLVRLVNVFAGLAGSPTRP